MDLKELLEQAKEASTKAYAPYSNYHVGSAVLTDHGVFTGANIENAATNLGICAERVALSKAKMQGVKEILAVAVYCADAQKNEQGEFKAEETMPCGGCRQWILELAPNAKIVTNGVSEPIYIKELLPYGFVFDIDSQRSE